MAHRVCAKQGSYILLPIAGEVMGRVAVTLRIWFRALPRRDAPILELVHASGSFRLTINARNALSVTAGPAEAGRLAMPGRLAARHWYEIALVTDAQAASARLRCRDLDADTASSNAMTLPRGPEGALHEVRIGAEARPGRPDRLHGNLDAKIEAPTLWSDVPADWASAKGGPDGTLAGRWDFSDMTDPDRAPDRTGRQGPALLVNAPTRAVTSSGWRGRVHRLAQTPGRLRSRVPARRRHRRRRLARMHGRGHA